LNQSIYENEMLAILHAVDIWCLYLLGKCFQIKTDHQILKYFLEQWLSSMEKKMVDQDVWVWLWECLQEGKINCGGWCSL